MAIAASPAATKYGIDDEKQHNKKNSTPDTAFSKTLFTATNCLPNISAKLFKLF